MKRLLKYLSNYKKESVLGPLFKLLEASFELIVPLIVAQIIDVGIKNENNSYIVKMIGVMVLLGLVGLVCSITAQFFAAKAAVGFGTALRRDLFKYIQRLSYTELDTIGSSTLITRLTSDINQVQSGVNLFLRLFLRSPFVVFGAMIMALFVNVKIAIVFIITIPLLAIIVFGIMLISIPLYNKVQKGLDSILRTISENLTGVRVIRAFHKEKQEREEFEQNNTNLVNRQLFVGKISALLNPITYVMLNGAILVIIWMGGLEVDSGIITQGEVFALINYMSQILVEMIKLANLTITINKSLACGDRIANVFEVTPSIMDSKERIEDTKKLKQESSVEFHDVSFRYKEASADSLTNITFSANAGETIGVIGGTGSGKTTLVNLIPRFYDVTNGKILVRGENVKDYFLEGLRERIGIVPQKAVLFKGTIRDNLKWGKSDATDEEIKIALEKSQAMEFVEEKTDGFEHFILQGGKNLSGGQKQRLAIARALVRQPEILILDDSSSALDYATDAKLRKAIRQMDKNMTVFIVSQRAASIQYADKIIVLDDGEMVGIGKHEELLKECQVYQEIYYSQFPKEDKNGA